MVDELFVGLSDEQLFGRPSADQWSIAECIEHLCQSARATAPKFDGAIDTGRRKQMLSDGPFRYGRLAVWFVDNAVDYPPKRRFKTSKVFAPPEVIRDRQQLLDDFVKWQEWLVELLNRSNGLDLQRVKVISPVSPLIRISLGQYIRLIVGHQIRHLKQAADVKSRLLPGTSLK